MEIDFPTYENSLKLRHGAFSDIRSNGTAHAQIDCRKIEGNDSYLSRKVSLLWNFGFERSVRLSFFGLISPIYSSSS